MARDSASARVLLVSDDPSSREQLATALEAEGYHASFVLPASAASCVDAGLDLIVVDLSASGSPDLIIGMLRTCTDVPIMAVTAVTVGEATVLGAFQAGADQCVNGFARPREFVARVRALLRRSPARPRPADAPASADVLAVEGFALDVARCTAIVADVEIALTAPECEILQALLGRPGRVVRRDELVAPELRASVLDSHVRRLRNKLEAVEGRRRILVVRGVGFRFDASGSTLAWEG